MSAWTYINGTITVDAVGRTQAEKEYILKTILDHLPLVTGSEEDMNVYLIQTNGHSSSSSADEFREHTNNLVDMYGDRSRKRGWLRTQSRYLIVVDGAFRHRYFEDTFLEFNKWLCRLAKRVEIEDVLVKLSDCEKEYLFTNKNDCYSEMFEYPSWSRTNEDGEPAWWEYLMWESDDSGYPRLLAYKYFNDEENDKKVEDWLKR